jgi:hypothetical protein
MNWRDFLIRWQEVLFSAANADDVLLVEARTLGWQAHPGATEEGLWCAEERLGLALPPSYRAFLRASNGWRPFEPFLPRLFSVRELAWYTPYNPCRKTPEDLAGAHVTGMPSLDDQVCCNDRGLSAADWVLDLEMALLVSEPVSSDDVVVLLHPNRSDASGEWEASFFLLWCGRGDRYRSFQELMLAQHARFQMHARYAPMGITLGGADPPDS